MAIWVGPLEGNVVDGGDHGRVWQSIDERETMKPVFGERGGMDVVVASLSPAVTRYALPLADPITFGTLSLLLAL